MMKANTLCVLLAGICFFMPAAAAQEGAEDNAPEKLSTYEQVIADYENKIARRVIGGSDAAPGSHPWQVSLQANKIESPVKAHFCGGVIIRPRWILTATHCVEGLEPKKFSISYGSTDLFANSNRFEIAKVYEHKFYRVSNSGARHNDIALVEMKEPIPFGEKVSQIDLISAAVESQLDKKADLVISGWGEVEVGGGNVPVLKEAGIFLVPNKDCNGRFSYAGSVTAQMICAAAHEKDSCKGDSGGPLTLGRGKQARLFGFVSWGDGCAVPNKYGVYARVLPFAASIEKIISREIDELR